MKMAKPKKMWGWWLILLLSMPGFTAEQANMDNQQSSPALTFDTRSGCASLLDTHHLSYWQPCTFIGQGKTSIAENRMELEAGNDLTGVTWTGPLVTINYEISLEAQRVTGTDFFCGLTVPVGKEHLTLICGGWGGSLVGISCIDYYDAANNLTCTTHRFENKRWYTIRLRITEHLIRAWIDDEQIVDLDTTEHHYSVRDEVEKSRPLGIASWQTHAQVRNLRLRKIQSFPRAAPTYSYTPERLEGWSVLASETLTDNHPELCKKTLRHLQNQLYRINQKVPAPALNQLKQVTIWVEHGDQLHRGMCYHPNANWLADNGYNPDKAGDIEIGNAQNFIDWSAQQPWMVLHELAHAYHHQVLGHDHQSLKDAFKQAKKSRTYEQVLHINGKTKPHYALNNVKEYLAEGTEAYFGTNDFYPFVRAELKKHDPTLYKLLQDVWK